MYLLSNKITTGIATYRANRNMQLFLFKGERPKNVTELSFDPYDISECVKNAVAYVQMESKVPAHWGNSSSIEFEKGPHQANWVSMYKINFTTQHLNPYIAGHNIPVKSVEHGSVREDGSFKTNKVLPNIYMQLQYGSNLIESSTSIADRNSYYTWTYQTPIVYDFGEIRDLDGIINTHFHASPYDKSRYMYFEYWDDVNSIWVEWKSPTFNGNTNIDVRTSNEGYTYSDVGAYGESSTRQFQVLFDETIRTSKVRIVLASTEKVAEPYLARLNNIQFLTNADVSSELAEEHEVTWALACPLLGGDNIHPQYTNEFLAIPVGKEGVDDPRIHPLMLEETIFGPLTGGTMPNITQCKLNMGLL